MKLLREFWIALACLLLFALQPAAAEELECRPTFASCGYYWTPPAVAPVAVQVHFRKASEQSWHEALPPRWFPEDRQFRGSVVHLQEDTAYELRIADPDGKPLAVTTFLTWNSRVPIARTVDITERLQDGGIRITDRGTPDGWICFTAKPGTVLDLDRAGNPSHAGLELQNAGYVILKDLTLRGGPQHGMAILNSQYVRVQNCDIAGFGETGTLHREPTVYVGPRGEPINQQAGIRVIGSEGTVIERCYIHDPRSPSTGWRYAHAMGANALFVERLSSTVVRWNDFVGTNERRWNDVIEGGGNFHPDGGFNQDADIHGNFLAFPNDDGTELDGGQVNVRFFENKVEGGYCGISLVAVMRGPSYVFNNLFVHAGDADGVCGLGWKDFLRKENNLPVAGGPAVYLNNTMVNNGGGVTALPGWRMGRNNVLVCAGSPYPSNAQTANFDYDLAWSRRGRKIAEDNRPTHTLECEPQFVDADRGLFALRPGSAGHGDGVRVANFAEPDAQGRVTRGISAAGSGTFPPRPLGFQADRGQMLFSSQDAPAQTVVVTADAQSSTHRLRIRKNESFGWFNVEPESATLKSGEQVTFTVTLVPGKMPYVGIYPGALLISRDDGLSAPVSVYAWKTGLPQEEIRFPSGVVMLDATKPEGGNPHLADAPHRQGEKALNLDPEKSGPVRWKFSIPAEGDYYVLQHLYAEFPREKHHKLSLGFDNDKPRLLALQLQIPAERWQWVGTGNPARTTPWLPAHFGLYHFSAGEHTLTLQPEQALLIDRIAIAPAFELQPGYINNFSDVPLKRP